MATASLNSGMVLKNTRHGLLASLREDADWLTLISEIDALKARGLEALDDNAVTFDLGWREISSAQFDLLIESLHKQGLKCRGILSTSHQTRTVAEERGYRAIIGRLGLAKHQGRQLRRAVTPPHVVEPPAAAIDEAATTHPVEPLPEAAADSSVQSLTKQTEEDPEAAVNSENDAESQGQTIDSRSTPPETLENSTPSASALEAKVSVLDPEVDEAAPQTAPSFGDEEPTLYLRRTLRSGQRVVFAGNVVVLGDVNPGAQVEADGDIVVLGHLRGSVHAGCEGDSGATVIASSLAATQLRIADAFYQQTNDRQFFKKSSQNGTMRARLSDRKIVVEPLPVR